MKRIIVSTLIVLAISLTFATLSIAVDNSQSATSTCRINWQSVITGASGHGEWLSKELATAWLNAADKKAEVDHLLIFHWIECKE
jgi:hypothetical protein